VSSIFARDGSGATAIFWGVHAEACRCTAQGPEKICDPTKLYRISFNETGNELEARLREKHPDVAADVIGFFGNYDARITVPPQFFEELWTTALAGDGVFRSIKLSVGPLISGKQYRLVFEVELDEISRANPVVVELQAVRAQLKSLKGWSGVAVVALGVTVALWIAHLWH
jgi:hypothetical protein